ncbi:MAG: patatin [Epsilonproteobacteria bacterium]|nr:patatin [Campylobacterota bacterium]
MKRRVALILGSGGARGYAHIGAIEILKEFNFEITSISGASMGALVGGLYAANKLKEYREWVESINVIDLLTLLDVGLGSAAIFKGDKVYSKLEELIGKVKIEELKIKYTAVAADIKNSKEYWFQEGDLLTAIRASSAIPAIFAPIKYKEMLLVDGGLLNPLPAAPLSSVDADLTIAINLYDKDSPIFDKKSDESKMLKWLSKFIPQNRLNIFDIADMTFDTAQYSLTKYRLCGYYPDIIVNIPKNICKTFEYYRAKEIIKIGKDFTFETLRKEKII